MSEYCKNCEQLKKENEYLKEWRRHSATCQECYEDGYQDGLRNNKKLIEYKHALEEIEGIVNKKTEIPICDECAYRNIPECKENCMQDVLGEILDIISKAKGEEK